MRYVGYSRGFHDGGLAIIEEDGTVSYASNSERYSKIKYFQLKKSFSQKAKC